MDEPVRPKEPPTPNEVAVNVRNACREVLRDYIGVLLRVDEDTANFAVTSEIARAAKALAVLEGI